jgi:hypothetical protein
MPPHVKYPATKAGNPQDDSPRASFGVPARLHHPMPIRELEIWTPFSLVKAFLSLFAVPARSMKANDL